MIRLLPFYIIALLLLNSQAVLGQFKYTSPVDSTEGDPLLGPHTERGILPGVNLCNIYLNGNTDELIINNRNTYVGAGSNFFLKPGFDISVYQKIKLAKFVALSLDLGVSFKAQKGDYNWRTIDSMGTDHASMVYTTNSETGKTNYHGVFIPFTIAGEIYPFNQSNVFFRIGIRPEWVMIDYSKTSYTDETNVYKIDTAGNQVMLNHTSASGKKKAYTGINIYKVFGIGFLINRSQRHTMHLEMDYFDGIHTFKVQPVPFKLSGIEIKLGVKI